VASVDVNQVDKAIVGMLIGVAVVLILMAVLAGFAVYKGHVVRQHKRLLITA